MSLRRHILLLSAAAFASAGFARADDLWISFPGGEGPGKGKHVVFVTGDEEYRGEEAAPMLARILSTHHGFKTTVLFSIDKEKGIIDPNTNNNIPGLEQLASADVMVMMLRFRELPDDKMKFIEDFLLAGKPFIAIRTSTHAFNFTNARESKYAKWSFSSKEWPGGFGQQVVGETWKTHHGQHGSESTRGVINPDKAGHPILKGVTDIWGPTDVYGIFNLPASTEILVRGQVLSGMKPDDKPVEGEKNNPMQPLIWLKDYQLSGGKTGKVLGSTIGAATDFESAGLRRLIVNAVYFLTGLEARIPAEAKVDYAGGYQPTAFGFNKFVKDRKPADYAK